MIEKLFGSHLIRSAAGVIIITILIKFIGLFKVIYIANEFGAQFELDSYLIAFMVLSFIINTFGAPVVYALVPTYVDSLKQNEDKLSKATLAKAFNSVFLITLLLTLFCWFILPLIYPIFAVGFNQSQTLYTLSLTRLLLPAFILNALSLVLVSALNSNKLYKLTALSPGFVPLLIICALALEDTPNAYTLVYGTLAGYLLEFLLLFIMTFFRKVIHLFDLFKSSIASLKDFHKQYFYMLSANIVMGGTFIVDQSMASMISEGSVSQLNYGNNFVVLFIALIAAAVDRVYLPYFSDLATQKKYGQLLQLSKTRTLKIMAYTVPVVLFLIFAANPLISFFFEHGAFAQETTKSVSLIQVYYSLQIPFYIGVIILTRLVSALKMMNILILAAVINFTANIFLNYFLIQWIGVAGIALSTSLVLAIYFIMTWIIVNKELQQRALT